MPERIIQGKAHVFGDNIDTDGIIAGKYTKTLDLQTLADHLLEDVDPHFRQRLQPGDVLVVGENFGCGSSREQAPLALKTAGIGAVIAKSFARIFFRNAINIGLPLLEVKALNAQTGDELQIDPGAGLVTNLNQGRTCQATPLPPIMVAILEAGGLVAYLRIHGDFQMPPPEVQGPATDIPSPACRSIQHE